MFALLGAIFFLLGAIIPELDSHNYVFWMMLGFAALALHFAYVIALPRAHR